MRIHFLIFLFVSLSLGCESEPKVATPEAPVVFQSNQAPYALTLAHPWKITSAAALNTFADLAANYDDTLYVIVIPQKLPAIPGVDPPDALALKRASLAVLEEKLKGFTIDRQGPIKLDNELGQSVFAHGQSEQHQVQYVATYVTRGDWGFQIVGWGPSEKSPLLIVEMDRILTSWKFTGGIAAPENLPPEPADSPDANAEEED